MNSSMKNVTPTSLDRLFNQNPLEMSDSDVSAIVEALRKDRLNWKPEEKKKAKVDAAPTLSLDDLDI